MKFYQVTHSCGTGLWSSNKKLIQSWVEEGNRTNPELNHAVFSYERDCHHVITYPDSFSPKDREPFCDFCGKRMPLEKLNKVEGNLYYCDDHKPGK